MISSKKNLISYIQIKILKVYYFYKNFNNLKHIKKNNMIFFFNKKANANCSEM